MADDFMQTLAGMYRKQFQEADPLAGKSVKNVVLLARRALYRVEIRRVY